jgi:hypothetical protein
MRHSYEAPGVVMDRVHSYSLSLSGRDTAADTAAVYDTREDNMAASRRRLSVCAQNCVRHRRRALVTTPPELSQSRPPIYLTGVQTPPPEEMHPGQAEASESFEERLCGHVETLRGRCDWVIALKNTPWFQTLTTFRFHAHKLDGDQNVHMHDTAVSTGEENVLQLAGHSSRSEHRMPQ